MKYFDVCLQKIRIRKVKPWIQPDAVVLDVGCFDGALFRDIKSKISFGYGMDPLLKKAVKTEKYSLFPGEFPADLPADLGPFDAVTAMAVFEHIPPDQQRDFIDGCRKVLKTGGRVILTVPDTQVDRILNVLIGLKVVDGMSLEEHHGFHPEETPKLFAQAGFELEYAGKFQLGLNNLFVFRKV